MTAAAAPAGPAPQPPPPARKNAATAHLCAAAYLDREFRDGVIDEVYHRRNRAIAPNQGADAVPVLRHALRARRLDAARYGLLAAALLALVCAPVAGKPWLLGGLLAWWLLGLPLRRFASGFATVPIERRPRLGPGAKALNGVGAGLLLVLCYLYLRGVFPPYLFEGDPGVLREDAGAVGARYGDSAAAGLETAALCLLILGALAGVFGAVRAASLTAVPGEREPAAPSDRRIAFIGEAQRAPVVNYHAGGSPFVGSGYELATWRFAITLRPADRAAEVTVEPLALNRHVRERLLVLGADSPNTVRLPNLRLTDQVHVSGRDTVRPTHHLSELPGSGYPFDSVEQVQRDPTTPARHFLRCEVVSWDGELVTTVHLHFALQGRTLYTEFSGCALPPTRDRYHVFGHDAVPKGVTVLLGFLAAAAAMPADLVRGPFETARELARHGRGGRRERAAWKGIAEDHGAVESIREMGTDIAEQNHFQYRDALKYLHILENQMLDALLEYLRANNIDLSELEERANTIVNNGVVNYGKLVTGAAGAGATATTGAVGDGSRGTVKGEGS